MQGDAMAHRSKPEAGKRSAMGRALIRLPCHHRTKPNCIKAAKDKQLIGRVHELPRSCLEAAPKQAAAALAPMAGAPWQACGSAADLLLF